ncbi:hypothetical protein [Actinacidiphila glaucinigra]|uniref:hypothetical protein n=1 Tax=Actinacidiphila glaucinigra TaxID=235986 RepID=UPI00371A880E
MLSVVCADAPRPLVRGPDRPLVTTGPALHEDGRWRVAEVGDGQVPDLTAGACPKTLAAALRALAGAPGGYAASDRPGRPGRPPLRNGASR